MVRIAPWRNIKQISVRKERHKMRVREKEKNKWLNNILRGRIKEKPGLKNSLVLINYTAFQSRNSLFVFSFVCPLVSLLFCLFTTVSKWSLTFISSNLYCSVFFSYYSKIFMWSLLIKKAFTYLGNWYTKQNRTHTAVYSTHRTQSK